jgi:hypothetical protein
MPDPIELLAQILDAVKKSPTFSSLLEVFEVETSSAWLQITREEARDMIRDVFPGPEVRLPDGSHTESRDFPIHGSGGWTLALIYRPRWLPTPDNVAAVLTGPGYWEWPCTKALQDRPGRAILARERA